MTIHHSRSLTAAAVAATGLLLAACSSGGTPTPANTADSNTHSTAIIDATQPAATTPGTSSGATPAVPAAATSACALVTEQQLTALLGTDPGPGQPTSDGTTTACAYTQGVAVSTVVDHNGGKSQFDQYCPDPAQPNAQNVSGVADGACLTIVGGTGPIAAMYILKGPALMSINIQAGLDTKITPDALSALGKIAAGRL